MLIFCFWHFQTVQRDQLRVGDLVSFAVSKVRNLLPVARLALHIYAFVVVLYAQDGDCVFDARIMDVR
jgi:hypothetical protein